ncbi:pyrimidine 5'-nucleotidase [Donghicola tyrosinivorans]|uniref:Putative hydrolase of the HAD superfamily n=1 Tax=Donghicola tyrosinivorans TaxID=1652492 RepID=A0A2T0WXJ9_9RHOB|nr:pyrimidine 5'-nucleotidase [Donghicola tyrosinivorans]PRY91304.1 putative hydrolase of the HAD superfamily [Donghicola tyrosinivorans]
MTRNAFSHVDTWVFDLDNTLYPPHMRLFDQIEEKMVNYVMRTLNVTAEHANDLRRTYWRLHGTTLAGLMAEHSVDPDPFLDEVHDIDFSVLSPDADLAEKIAALPGRKIIYTNGAAPYARNVLEARGLSGLFDAIYGVEHAGYRPKPEAAAFERVFAMDKLDPKRAAMFEDDPRNLTVPHAIGMRTVHVAPQPEPADHIHFHTPDLNDFLSRLTD